VDGNGGRKQGGSWLELARRSIVPPVRPLAPYHCLAGEFDEWMAVTLAGKSFSSEKWFVEANGRIVKTPL